MRQSAYALNGECERFFNLYESNYVYYYGIINNKMIKQILQKERPTFTIY